MSKLPQIKPKKLVKLFIKQGFKISRQVGSHIRLIDSNGRKITVAIHNKPIASGTLQSILKQAKVSREEFLDLIK